jgi:hypothetical protein
MGSVKSAWLAFSVDNAVAGKWIQNSFDRLDSPKILTLAQGPICCVSWLRRTLTGRAAGRAGGVGCPIGSGRSAGLAAAN